LLILVFLQEDDSEYFRFTIQADPAEKKEIFDWLFDTYGQPIEVEDHLMGDEYLSPHYWVYEANSDGRMTVSLMSEDAAFNFRIRFSNLER
jgi:hypothetical protein